MKNLKKLSKSELKSIQGAAQACYYLANGTLYCPCKPGYYKCPDGSCRQNQNLCFLIDPIS
ncbi:hypothetical protein J3D55_001182 [Chryseobacterium ginsenosidimutans]|jgi:hypothetical protein|uniref:bacteriocin-like protein n=1 Tax=Chryseobacterium ginsenosidimutans TaxID=687846 RepID=UPI0040425848|nr:hypothetical protein [Chryseobacterium ginsenosidimutans]